MLSNIAGFGVLTRWEPPFQRYGEAEKLTLLIDIGTNENGAGDKAQGIACSTAAGPPSRAHL
jgi:hypothetical protein